MIKRCSLSIISSFVLILNFIEIGNTYPISSITKDKYVLGDDEVSNLNNKSYDPFYIANTISNASLNGLSIQVEEPQAVDRNKQFLKNFTLVNQILKVAQEEETNSIEEEFIIGPDVNPREVKGDPEQDLRRNIPNIIDAGRDGRCQPLGLELKSGVFNSSSPNLISAPRVATSIEDTQFVNSAFLLAKPRLGQQTCLTAAVGGSLVRYARIGNDSNYNLLNFSAGIEQELTPNTHAELVWLQQQFYQDGQRTSLDNSVAFLVQHQQELVENKLWLEPSYLLETTFSNPASDIEDLSRIANNLRVNLNYKFTSRLFGRLNYQINYSRFTGSNSKRDETKQRAGAELLYALDQQGIIWLNGSVSYLFGSSRDITGQPTGLDNLVVGLELVVGLPLF